MLDTRRFGFGQQGAWIKGHGERLASIREMLTKISQESESTKTKADLMDISDLLEELIQDVADVSRAAQSRPETSPPKTPI
jgi:hypothetical protein